MKIILSAIRIILVGELAAALLAGSDRSVAADVASAGVAPVLQEVIVTATKRAENVQEVATAVSVESGDELVKQGLTSLAQYAANVPGFDVVSDGTPGQTSVSIRGVSSNTATSAVGVYLDDTPIGSSAGDAFGSTTLLDMLPYDLERIEVLRGPQGTLYGAGSMGGLIKYVLKTASATKFQAEAGSDLIDIDGAGKLGYSLRSRVNVPVIDRVLGVSLSAFEQTTPGYMTNIFPGAAARDTNEDHQFGGRLAALWQPLPNLTVKLTALTEVIEADDSAFRQSSATAVPNAGGALLLAPAAPLPDLTESVAFLAPYDQHLYYTGVTIDWNVGPFEVVSATSWSKQSSFLGGDITPQYGSILPYVGGTSPGLANILNFFGLRKLTQELRLVSPKGRTLEWLAGSVRYA